MSASHNFRTRQHSVPRARHPGTAPALVALCGASMALCAAVGWVIHMAVRARPPWGTDEPPADRAQEVNFLSARGDVHLHGWFLRALGVPAAPGPTVILGHGIWTGRRECLPWALRLQERGFNVLCFDFRAHGPSTGRYVTLGFHEADDILGAAAYVRVRPDVDPSRIAVVGFSMGAVAALLAAAASQDLAAVVADSAYSSLARAIGDNCSALHRVATYPLGVLGRLWLRWLARVDPAAVRPRDVIARIAPRPVLIIHGADDRLIPPQHAFDLFQAAAEPKELWIVPGAGHVGSRDLIPEQYMTRVDHFLRRALRLERTVENTREAVA